MSEIVLHIPRTGTEARILPDLGFNCYAFKAHVGGRLIDVLDAEPGFESGEKRPSGSGIPLLFPFPNRIRAGKFTWDGRSYELPATDGRGNAIHGFVLDRPWRVMLTDEQTAVGEFQLSVDAPDRRDLWPADFLIEVRYTLQESFLRADIRIVNADDKPLPWGFGTHPYFRVPLAPESRMLDCLVQVPAAEQWELAELLPTGKRLPVEERNDLREGQTLGGDPLDDVLTGVTVRDGRIESIVMDAKAGLQIAQTTDSIFRECVVYTPPGRPSVCVEPYTCVTDAINLQQQGIDAGLRVLEPGGEFHTWIEIRAGLIYA